MQRTTTHGTGSAPRTASVSDKPRGDGTVLRIDRPGHQAKPSHEMQRKGARFDRVANLYEFAATVYSTGQIAVSKAWQVQRMWPGERVLYVGVGAGEDAVLAAARGVDLTCIDISARMLEHARRKLSNANLHARLICNDVRNHDIPTHYDVITANFFLNCFEPREMHHMLEHLTRLLRPQGRIMISDVAPAQGNRLARWIHGIHHGIAMRGFHAMGLVPVHPVYDYCPNLERCGLDVTERALFRLAAYGPVAYQAIIAERLGDIT